MEHSNFSVRIFNTRVEALAGAEVMRKNGFVVDPSVEFTKTISWEDSTGGSEPQDAKVPAWVVVGRR